MHSGQRLCSGHLSNEACKVLTSSFGHVFPPFPRLSLGAIAFPFPFTTLARRVGGWGFGGGGRRGLGRDLGLAGRMRCRLTALSVRVPRALPALVPGPIPLRRGRTPRAHPGASEPSELSEKNRVGSGATSELAAGAAALPTPRRRPTAPGGTAVGPPPGPLGPSLRALGPPPPLPPQQRRRKSVCVSVGCAGCVWRGGRDTETNNKPPPARPRPPLLFGNEFWQEISS